MNADIWLPSTNLYAMKDWIIHKISEICLLQCDVHTETNVEPPQTCTDNIDHVEKAKYQFTILKLTFWEGAGLFWQVEEIICN